MIRFLFIAAAAMAAAISSKPGMAEGDPENGARAFRACAGCHSLEPGRHMTGPSLAGIWGQTAGTIADFPRYSAALTESGVVWTADTLDPWIENPQAVIPGNRMTFPGIKDRQTRADLIAFLKAAGHSEDGETGSAAMPMSGMASGDMPDLEALDPANQVASLTYCGDTYTVTTGTGETLPFWEFNLRFKTDSSDRGPVPGVPALLPASMAGDRAFVIFAAPEEISAFIERRC